MVPSDSRQRMSSVSASTAAAAAVPKDYMEMDENTVTSNLYRRTIFWVIKRVLSFVSAEMVFPLQEVRSYISNSTESCWSPHSSEGKFI